MAEVNRISSFKSFSEIKAQENEMKLREENNLKKQETLSKISEILDEMGLTNLSEIDEESQQAFIAKLLGREMNEGNAFVYAASKAKAEGKDEFEFNGKKYKVTIKDTGLKEGNAFVFAAAKAKAEGKDEFEFNGKKYKVTIKDTGLKEGNAFGDAVRKAKEEGATEFEFDGKTFKVEEASVNEGAHGMAIKLLQSLANGETSKVEGLKMSKELATHYINWIKTSPYGKKNGNLPLNMLIDASFNWGIERGLDPSLKSELKDLKGMVKESFLLTEGTRGQFGKIDKQGNITSVYTHYDSYPENMLPIIKKAFKNAKAVNAVIAKGDNSGLDVNFDKINFYGSNSAPYTGSVDKIKNYIKFAQDQGGAEYIYLYDERDKKWYMVDIYGGSKLVPAFESLSVFEATVEMDAMDPDNKDFLKFLKKHKVEIIDKRMDGPGGGHPVITMQGKRKDLEAVLADEDYGWADPDLAEYIEESFVQLFEATVLVDAVDPDDKDFLKFLKKNKVKIVDRLEDGPSGFPEITLQGSRKDLEKVLADEDFGWGDPDLADFIEESLVNEGAVKQFEMDFSDMVKNIQRGYGWIDPEFVADTWENSSDSIDFELVKGEIYNRLIKAGLLWYSDEDGEEKGKQVKSLKELGIKESLVNEAKLQGDEWKLWVDIEDAITSLVNKYKGKVKSGKIKEFIEDYISDLNESAVNEAEIKSDDEFKEYAFNVLKKAFGSDFDEAKGQDIVDGILGKVDGDYGAAVGMLTSSLGESVVTEGIWPKSKLASSFQFKLADELKQNFKGVFYSIGNDLYHNDEKVYTVDGDKDSIDSIILKLKKIINESYVAEGFDANYWEDYHEGAGKIENPNDKQLQQEVSGCVEDWNDNNENGAENEVTSAGEKKVFKLAKEFVKAKGWISSDVIDAMIAQES